MGCGIGKFLIAAGQTTHSAYKPIRMSVVIEQLYEYPGKHIFPRRSGLASDF
jgi:hypothetical protein